MGLLLWQVGYGAFIISQPLAPGEQGPEVWSTCWAGATAELQLIFAPSVPPLQWEGALALGLPPYKGRGWVTTPAQPCLPGFYKCQCLCRSCVLAPLIPPPTTTWPPLALSCSAAGSWAA